MPVMPTVSPEHEHEELPRRRRLSWAEKFGVAFRGWKLGVRGHASFFVHFFFTALVVAAAVTLGCDAYEWCLLIGCIGFVLTTELVNSAVETLFRGLPAEIKDRVWPSLDISAGAVLLASLTSSVIGLIILLPKLPKLARWLNIF